MKKIISVFLSIVSVCLVLCSCESKEYDASMSEKSVYTLDPELVPEYSGKIFVTLNNNIPSFTEEEKSSLAFKKFSDTDVWGRSGTAFMCASSEFFPKVERDEVNIIRPSGWQEVKCDIADGGYLYTRCELLGYNIAGENYSKKNLITATRYMYLNGLHIFESKVVQYIKDTGNRVLYRVTPLFKGDNMVAHGVQIEALSVEDDGKGICFNVFVYNVQPGVSIDYATGKNSIQ